MNKTVRTMRFLIRMDFCPAKEVIKAIIPPTECYNEDVECAFSVKPGSSGAENELAIEQEGKNLYIPFISANYKFFQYITEFNPEKLKEQGAQAIFGDIAVVTDGSDAIYIVDANPAHNSGVVFKMLFKDLHDKVTHIIVNSTKEG